MHRMCTTVEKQAYCVTRTRTELCFANFDEYDVDFDIAESVRRSRGQGLCASARGALSSMWQRPKLRRAIGKRDPFITLVDA